MQSYSYNSLLMMKNSNNIAKKRDTKFQEHSWSIFSANNETYQNQQIIDSKDGGGLINSKWDIKQLIQRF